jgi:TonB family protein
LRGLRDAIGVGDYGEAMAILKEAKKSHASNVYLTALERQMNKLVALSTGNELTEDVKLQILDSVDGIIEIITGPNPPSGEPATTPSGRLVLPPRNATEGNDRDAVFNTLKLQLFQQAGEALKKGDYERALAEIRRVYIIDPTNELAKRFEAQVEQLQGNTPANTRTQPPVSAEPSPDETPPVPKGNEAQKNPPPPAVEELSDEEPSAASSKNKALIGAIAGIIILVAGAVLLFSPAEENEPAAQSPGSPTTEVKPTATETQHVTSAPVPSPTSQNPAPPPAPAGAAVKPNAAEESPAAKIEEPKRPTKSRQAVADAGPSYEKISRTADTHPGSGSPAPSVDSAVHPAEEPTAEPFIAVETDPTIVKLEKPEFPDFAVHAKLEGQVIARVLIDAQGNPIQIKILKSSNSVFNNPVINAIKKSTFTPGKMSTGPVSAWLTIPFKFKSNN